MVARERRQLHRVLEQARAGGEARTREIGGPRVVLPDGAQDVRVVDPGLVRDHEELVGDRELHVAPRIGEQLRELGLLRGCPHRRRRERPEQRLGPVPRAILVRPDDLGQRAELLERVPLGDALRAERDVDPAAALGEVLGDVARRPRVDRAPEHDEGAVAQMRRDLVDGLLEDRHRGAEEFVDGRPDDDDEPIGSPDHRPVGPELEPAGREDLPAGARRPRLSRNGISPAAMRSIVAWFVS